jgi:hypothetical protein
MSCCECAKDLLMRSGSVQDDLVAALFLDGKKIVKQALRDGDIITFGADDSYQLTCVRIRTQVKNQLQALALTRCKGRFDTHELRSE